VNGQAHAGGIESFRSMFKQGCHETCHKMPPKRLGRLVSEFAARCNAHRTDTAEQPAGIAVGMVDKRLRCRDLVAGNGLPLGAR